ncbi:MAG: amidoligase family protein [Butyricicoccus sp.]|nr:amidoligase family protein [Butyricicoccus sp.]
MRELERCSVCGEAHSLGSLIEFDDQLLCPSCIGLETTTCSRCGRRIWNDDNAGDDRIPLCRSCYDNFYTTCEHCGRTINCDDAYYADEDCDQDDPLCWSCYCRSQRDKEIHDYSYKPTPIFYGKGSRYYGVELEIDAGGEDSDHACQLMRQANRGVERVYCKHDGSLSDGFEIVTHPMTLEYHQQSMPWLELLGEAVKMGYLSHKANTCGLHIHVNRSAFGYTETQQEMCIARILYIVEKFWDELLKFSRRSKSQLDRWAARYGYKDQPMEILDSAKSGCGRGRYASVNLQNSDTIEFRIFRGTLKYNTLIATVQLVDRICDLAVNMSDELLQAMAWTSFVSGCTQPELVQYLKEQRLYVNEPVTNEEEI